MRNKKLASLLAIAVLSLAAPFFAIPRASAYHTGGVSVDITGTVIKGTDKFFDTTVTAAREGSVVNFYTKIVMSSLAGQRNLTLGVKFDWMTGFVNASNANPTSTLAATKDQYVTAAVSVTMPMLTVQYVGYNLNLHTWELRVWSGKLNSANATAGCSDTGILAACASTSGGGFAIYSTAQADGITLREEAEDKIDHLSARLTLPTAATPPAGWSKATADVSQADAELGLGDSYYDVGDFAAAKTHYQNALNLANSALSALGGGESADYVGALMSSTGWLLGGVAAILLGLGGFMYLNRRSKTPAMPRP